MFRLPLAKTLRPFPPVLPPAQAAAFHTLPPLHERSSSRPPPPPPPPPGANARTDATIKATYPAPSALPTTRPGPLPTTSGGAAAAAAPPVLPTFSLASRVCVVTGGARGLGLVMARGLAASGAHVALVDLNGEEASRAAAALDDEIASAAAADDDDAARPVVRVTAHRADVADEASVRACVAAVLAAHGRIDHLVTSAGFTENFEAVEYPADRMRRLFEVNVDGTYLFAAAVARHLMARGARGSMVFIGSMSGSIVNVPQPQAPYNASKAAVRHLAASFAVEWAAAGIRVNCISPGYMLTSLTQKILDDNPDLKAKWTSLIPQGKMGVPEDLMGPVAFLLSDAASYITGADLRVDGGYTVT